MLLARVKSFRAKLVLLVVVACALAAVLVGPVLVVRNYISLRAQALAEMTTLARSQVNHAITSVQFDMPEDTERVLSALVAAPNVGAAAVYTPEGEIFAQWHREGRADLLPDAPPRADVRQRGWQYVVEVMRDQEGEQPAGTLVLAYDMGSVMRQLNRGLAISIAMTLVALGAALLIALRLQRAITGPLAELLFTARRVSDTQNYSIRARKYEEDEIGQFTDVFNEMLGRIDTHNEAIRAANERFRTAVEASPNGMVMVDERGIIVLANETTEQLFGYDRNELVGQPVEMLVPQRFRDHARFRTGFFESPEARPMGAGRDLYGLRKDGTEFPVEIGLNPIETDEGLRVLSSIVDITQRKAAEEEREMLLASERAARSDAERASRMKDEFVATLSHELRTPLTAILGWAQMLRRGTLGEAEHTQGLDIIERNARVQTQLIEDLLDMSRIMSGKIRLDVQEVELPEVIDAALQTVQPAADAKEIRLQKVIDSRVKPVHGDPDRLQQIVWNLLSNAIKFTPKGGRVQVALQRINSHIEINISDTGEGIDPEFLPHIFERFRQADPSTTRRHGGLGLGLAIVKHLLELHGGTISASSPGLGKGSTFSIRLPLAIVHPRAEFEERRHPLGGKAVPVTAGEAATLEGVKVLVVEDEPDARELIARVLAQRKADVQAVASGDEALDKLREFMPDVLVSDIGMPEMDGYELIRRVRALGRSEGGSIAAVALTAFARTEDRTRALLAGYQMHVAKPVDPTELIASVASLAALRAPRSGGLDGRHDGSTRQTD